VVYSGACTYTLDSAASLMSRRHARTLQSARYICIAVGQTLTAKPAVNYGEAHDLEGIATDLCCPQRDVRPLLSLSDQPHGAASERARIRILYAALTPCKAYKR